MGDANLGRLSLRITNVRGSNPRLGGLGVSKPRSLWRDKHPAIKGVRPPEHHAGKFRLDQKDSSESKNKGLACRKPGFLEGDKTHAQQGHTSDLCLFVPGIQCSARLLVVLCSPSFVIPPRARASGFCAFGSTGFPSGIIR